MSQLKLKLSNLSVSAVVGFSAVLFAGGVTAKTNVVATNALKADSIEEVKIIGDRIGGERLDAVTGAGGRLGLSILDTPASIDLITSADIAIKGDNDVLDTITRATGISGSASPGSGGMSVSSRGFNGQNSTLVTYNGTRLYVAAGTVSYPSDTWVLDRVEVLRGAGSVVNGIGALGTSINYLSKQPSFDATRFQGELGIGSFGLSRLALGGGNTINDEWAYRIDAVHHEKDGYVDRAEEERDVVSGSLTYRPSSDLNVTFSMDYADVNDAPYWGTPLIDGQASSEHRKQNYNFGDGSVEYQDVWSRVHTDWKLSDTITFRNDTYLLQAEREWQNLEEYSFNAATGQIDRAYYLGIIQDQEQLGTRSDFLIETELFGKPSVVSIGGDLNIIDLDYLNNFSTGGFSVSDSVALTDFNPGLLPIDSIPTILDYATDITQFALFADYNLELSDTLNFVLGARYDVIDFERYDYAIGANPASEFDSDYKDLTWRAGLVYQPIEDLSLYVQFSTSVDPVTSPVSMSESNKNYDPSEGKQFEMGIKQRIFSGKGEYSLSYFNITKKDLLTQLPASAIVEQVGQQSSEGIEATLRLSPSDKVSFDFNLALVDAQYDEFFSGGLSLAGNQPRNIPEVTSNLWLNYTPNDVFQIGGGLRYVAERFVDTSNTSALPAYTVFDASASWQISERVTLSVKGRNLSNEDDYVLAQYVTDQWIFGDPRSYEVTLGFDF